MLKTHILTDRGSREDFIGAVIATKSTKSAARPDPAIHQATFRFGRSTMPE